MEIYDPRRQNGEISAQFAEEMQTIMSLQKMPGSAVKNLETIGTVEKEPDQSRLQQVGTTILDSAVPTAAAEYATLTAHRIKTHTGYNAIKGIAAPRLETFGEKRKAAKAHKQEEKLRQEQAEAERATEAEEKANQQVLDLALDNNDSAVKRIIEKKVIGALAQQETSDGEDEESRLARISDTRLQILNKITVNMTREDAYRIFDAALNSAPPVSAVTETENLESAEEIPVSLQESSDISIDQEANEAEGTPQGKTEFSRRPDELMNRNSDAKADQEEVISLKRTPSPADMPKRVKPTAEAESATLVVNSETLEERKARIHKERAARKGNTPGAEAKPEPANPKPPKKAVQGQTISRSSSRQQTDQEANAGSSLDALRNIIND